MGEKLQTVGKLIAVHFTGIGLSFSHVESILRIVALLVSIALSILVFIRDNRKRKLKDEQD